MHNIFDKKYIYVYLRCKRIINNLSFTRMWNYDLINMFLVLNCEGTLVNNITVKLKKSEFQHVKWALTDL